MSNIFLEILLGLTTAIAVLTLVIKILIDRKNSKNNPINWHEFITDNQVEHTRQSAMLEEILKALERIEDKL